MPRTFSDEKAIRSQVPLLVGIYGASGSGKTYSALRLATGMQKVIGGEIFGIDTESRRMTHYADIFDFRHIPFSAPFSPDDYREAIEYCKQRGASTVIVDSMSHEHEGPGGVLEWHEAELDRMTKDIPQNERNAAKKRMTFLAWARPKAARRRLINAILQLGVNAIFCFRAKEKIRIVSGADPIDLGWMPVGGEEFPYEMTVNCLLYPGAKGVPTWGSSQQGEKQMLKLPVQFEDLFKAKRSLDEATGEALASWAKGGDVPAATVQQPTQRPPWEEPHKEQHAPEGVDPCGSDMGAGRFCKLEPGHAGNHVPAPPRRAA